LLLVCKNQLLFAACLLNAEGDPLQITMWYMGSHKLLDNALSLFNRVH